MLKVQINLAQFQLGGFFLEQQPLHSGKKTDDATDANLSPPVTPLEAETLTKLKFIESIIGKYRESNSELAQLATATMADETNTEAVLPKSTLLPITP
ncbi:hypothetical protein [Thermocoleostomius sinensis]|uniref:Uncharacterized protein n=1 Tax=Thermocoleostomius sinensis A174 TaxID=2016057 RepID=A0A9E8ZGK8_9CYAN|nr:hypothetical protein [Thermocoleostomius sinensis]WAL62722.1 hypothetical protein OXH18_12230 [Thermocoleostomius sinensis A174]